MTCPNCHAEVGAGKKFCGKCGAPITATAAPLIGAPPISGQCPKCGLEVQPGRKFCGRCGSALTSESTQAPRQVLEPAMTPMPPSQPALMATVKVQPPGPPLEQKFCAHCGVPLRAGAKFCKRCGKSLSETAPSTVSPAPELVQVAHVPTPAEMRVASQPAPPPPTMPRAATPVPQAAQVQYVPIPAPAGRPSEPVPVASATPRVVPAAPEAAPAQSVPIVVPVSSTLQPGPFPTPAGMKKGTLALIVGLFSLVVLGAAIGYFKIHHRAVSTTAKTEQPVQGSSAQAGPVQPVSTPTTTVSTAVTQPQNAAQPSPSAGTAAQNTIPTQAGESPTTISPPEKQKAKPAAPPPPVAPAYQQAHVNALQAFAAERYIDPPDDCALYWARKATEQGDPTASQIAEQILGRMAQKVQQARAERNYDLSLALLTKLAMLYPDHPELQRLTVAAQQEQQDYARRLQRQRQKP